MEVLHISLLKRIKANANAVVKLLLPKERGCVLSLAFRMSLGLLFLLHFLSSQFLYSADTFSYNPQSPLTSPPSEQGGNPLVDSGAQIAAKTYPLNVVERSGSGKVYLFDDPEGHQPEVGRLLLLKRKGLAVMAVRVLKLYNEKKMLAAKRVKRYQKSRSLDDGESLWAIEKLGDISTDLSHLSREDLKELGELEKNHPKALSFDPELDAATSPPLKKEPIEQEELVLEPGDLNGDASGNPSDIEIDPEHITVSQAGGPLDHHLHWLSAGFGFLRNSGPPAVGGTYNFASGNLRYGYSLVRSLFLNHTSLQDSLTLEGGFYFYKTLNFVIQGDAYTTLTLVTNLRYNFIFSERFGAFLYAGLVKSQVLSSVQASDSAVSGFSKLGPALGVGGFVQVGPSWYLRGDIGIESMSLNLLLHF